MKIETIRVQNRLGLHARPCSLLVKTANKFRSEFYIKKDDMKVNGKSIMGVMMLAAECDSVLELITEGVDEDEAMEAILTLLETRFDED